MPVEQVTPASGRYVTPPVRAPKQELDGEVFMQLLVTQLRNQDPSSPMDTNAMIAQTTQLASMEKLVEIATKTDEAFGVQMRSHAADLLGRSVSYLGEDGVQRTGIATAVSYSGPVPLVTVDGAEVPLDAVAGITTKAGADAPVDQAATEGAATTTDTTVGA